MNPQQEFQKMNPVEKKNFLSMDLIYRMIHLEQKVCAAFRRKVHYTETEYYKSLNFQQRQMFEDYLKKKKVAKLALFILGVPLIGGVIASSVMVGHSILDNSVVQSSKIGAYIAAALILIVILALVHHFYSHSKHKKRMNSHLSPIRKAVVRRHLAR
jgi:hypothetical protein